MCLVIKNLAVSTSLYKIGKINIDDSIDDDTINDNTDDDTYIFDSEYESSCEAEEVKKIN